MGSRGCHGGKEGENRAMQTLRKRCELQKTEKKGEGKKIFCEFPQAAIEGGAIDRVKQILRVQNSRLTARGKRLIVV